MKTKCLLLLLAFPLLPAGCTKVFESRSHVVETCEGLAPQHQGLVFTDDIYVNNFADEVLDWRNIEKSYAVENLTVEKYVSPHDHASINSFRTISEGNDFLVYFNNSKGDSTPICVSVESNKLNRPKGFHVGQPVSYFQERFKFYQNAEVIRIYAIEGNYITLAFVEGVLDRFWYSNSYVD